MRASACLVVSQIIFFGIADSLKAVAQCIRRLCWDAEPHVHMLMAFFVVPTRFATSSRAASYTVCVDVPAFQSSWLWWCAAQHQPSLGCRQRVPRSIFVDRTAKRPKQHACHHRIVSYEFVFTNFVFHSIIFRFVSLATQAKIVRMCNTAAMHPAGSWIIAIVLFRRIEWDGWSRR